MRKNMHLQKIMVAKNVSEIHLHFHNENNSLWESDEEDQEQKDIEGVWSGTVTFKNGSLMVDKEINYGDFDEVVADMKAIVAGTYDYDKDHD